MMEISRKEEDQLRRQFAIDIMPRIEAKWQEALKGDLPFNRRRWKRFLDVLEMDLPHYIRNSPNLTESDADGILGMMSLMTKFRASKRGQEYLDGPRSREVIGFVVAVGQMYGAWVKWLQTEDEPRLE